MVRVKEKLLQFFTGKMSKSIYIAIASAVVCGAVVITSTVIVHNNNQKIDSVLEGLSTSENVSELSSESLTESISASDNINTQQNSNSEPAGDKALQYLAEYDKLTAEYEAKRAELAQETLMTATKRKVTAHPEPHSRARLQGGAGNYLETEEEYNSYLAEFQKQHSQWEQESRQAEIEESEAQRKADEEKARTAEAQRRLDALDAQYQKDVAALKAKYGIA